jgi:hypothetical protein
MLKWTQTTNKVYGNQKGGSFLENIRNWQGQSYVAREKHQMMKNLEKIFTEHFTTNASRRELG